MHKDLERAFNKLVEILKKDDRCEGAWHYGSISRGEEDIYSDYDPVTLVYDKYFEDFDKDVPKFLESISDELLIFWAEDFNDSNFKNYCSVIRLGENLHQLDFFIVNADHTDAWMCRQHLKGCTMENLIFDRKGDTVKLLDKGLRTECGKPDIKRAMDTYWFHLEMLIKYFKRKDIFKVIKNLDFLFHSHVDILLYEYDNLDWGPWETKVKRCVPEDKKEHLKAYFTKADLCEIERAVKECIYLFKTDSEEICNKYNISYSSKIGEKIISYFNRRMEDNI